MPDTRNADLEAGYRSGQMLYDLATRYQITPQRVQQILRGRGVVRTERPRPLAVLDHERAEWQAERAALLARAEAAEVRVVSLDRLRRLYLAWRAQERGANDRLDARQRFEAALGVQA